MTEKIIFYLPFELQLGYASGSTVRPTEMLKAFRKIGLDVIEILGTSPQRKRLIEENKRHLLDKETVGIYVESSTTPMALTDQDHLPRHPWMDAKFFRHARTLGVPVGLFYRDIHWRFPLYRDTVAWYKRIVAYSFYWLELYQLRQALDVLFLPSLSMAKFVPELSNDIPCIALPPGGQGETDNVEIGAANGAIYSRNERLTFLYVGGVSQDLYDIRPLLSIFNKIADISLNLCCRESEWKRYIFDTNIEIPPNVNVVHVDGRELSELYTQCDVVCLLYRKHAYRKFAMPVKLFEAIGHGKPILVNSDTAAGEFVAKERIGWTVHSPEEAMEVINLVMHNRDVLHVIQSRIAAIRGRHSWEARAREVVSVFKKLKEGPTKE